MYISLIVEHQKNEKIRPCYNSGSYSPASRHGNCTNIHSSYYEYHQCCIVSILRVSLNNWYKNKKLSGCSSVPLCGTHNYQQYSLKFMLAKVSCIKFQQSLWNSYDQLDYYFGLVVGFSCFKYSVSENWSVSFTSCKGVIVLTQVIPLKELVSIPAKLKMVNNVENNYVCCWIFTDQLGYLRIACITSLDIRMVKWFLQLIEAYRWMKLLWCISFNH